MVLGNDAISLKFLFEAMECTFVPVGSCKYGHFSVDTVRVCSLTQELAQCRDKTGETVDVVNHVGGEENIRRQQTLLRAIDIVADAVQCGFVLVLVVGALSPLQLPLCEQAVPPTGRTDEKKSSVTQDTGTIPWIATSRLTTVTVSGCTFLPRNHPSLSCTLCARLSRQASV